MIEVHLKKIRARDDLSPAEEKTIRGLVSEVVEVGADRAGRAGEAGDLDELGRRQMRLRNQQMGDDRIARRKLRRALGRREAKAV